MPICGVSCWRRLTQNSFTQTLPTRFGERVREVAQTPMGGFWNKCARAYKRADQPKDPETLELVFLFVIAIVLSYMLFLLHYNYYGWIGYIPQVSNYYSRISSTASMFSSLPLSTLLWISICALYIHGRALY